MSTPANKFYPGWKMTHGQHSTYFRLLTQVYAAQGLKTSAEKEGMRKHVHFRAFGREISAKEIDHMKGFDAFKAAALAIISPTNLEAQLHQAEMPLIRLRHRIRELHDEAYINCLVRSPRFKKQALEDLNEQELTDLRNMLCDRQTEEHKPGTLDGRRARAASRREEEIPADMRPF